MLASLTAFCVICKKEKNAILIAARLLAMLGGSVMYCRTRETHREAAGPAWGKGGGGGGAKVITKDRHGNEHDAPGHQFLFHRKRCLHRFFHLVCHHSIISRVAGHCCCFCELVIRCTLLCYQGSSNDKWLLGGIMRSPRGKLFSQTCFGEPATITTRANERKSRSLKSFPPTSSTCGPSCNRGEVSCFASYQIIGSSQLTA